MDTEESLRQLLEICQWPWLVAQQLGVSTDAVYTKMATFGIPRTYPRYDQILLRIQIAQLREEIPGISISRMAKLLGVAWSTVSRHLKIMKPEQEPPAEPPAERPMSSAESRLRDALRRLVYPRLVAVELGLKLTAVYEMMEHYNLELPFLDSKELTLTVLQVLQERPVMSTQDLSQLTGMTRSSVSIVLRSERIYRRDLSPSPISTPSSMSSLEFQEAEKVDYEEYEYDHETALKDLFGEST